MSSPAIRPGVSSAALSSVPLPPAPLVPSGHPGYPGYNDTGAIVRNESRPFVRGQSDVFHVPTVSTPAPSKYSPAEAARAVDIMTRSIYRNVMTVPGRDNRWKMRFVTGFLSHLTDEMRTSRTEGPKPLEDEHSGVELNVVLLITEMRSQGFGFDHIALVAARLISCMATDWNK